MVCIQGSAFRGKEEELTEWGDVRISPRKVLISVERWHTVIYQVLVLYISMSVSLSWCIMSYFYGIG
jgi:hypothetical protein